MRELASESIDSVICDPPYELGFMGKKWDGTGIAYDPNVWRECLRVLKPGGHLLAFGGSRTYHRMACASADDRECIHMLMRQFRDSKHEGLKASRRLNTLLSIVAALVRKERERVEWR